MARRAAQTAERRESDLQLRRDRVSAESFKEREARLHPRRERLAAESSEEREARLYKIIYSRGVNCRRVS